MPFHCVVGGSRASREAAGLEITRRAPHRDADPVPASRWPFARHVVPAATTVAPHTLWIPDLHHAFLAGQTPGTRLVLTQSTYQLQRWLDWLAHRPGVAVVAHASRTALTRSAPEAFASRGPWAHIELVQLDGDDEDEPAEDDSSLASLHRAFRDAGVEQRLETVHLAAEHEPENPALHLAVASVRMELQDPERAQVAIERALALAPDWEAVWFEYGKLWLRADDLELAAERFAEAARLMPSFSSALSNLGAALAETDRPDAAIEALQQALYYDPAGYPVHNNLAVVLREAGRLDEAIDAGRRVVALAPDFVFGYYNLGHALFLHGRFSEARDAYAEGHRRDPQKNVVQACRAAVAGAAAGEWDRAAAELQAASDALPPEARVQVLGEAAETLEALIALPDANTAELERVLGVVKRGMKH